MIQTGLKKVRRWYQIQTGQFETPFDGEVPFWVISLCIQCVLLAILAKLFLPGPLSSRHDVVFVGETNEIIDLSEDNIPELEFDDFDIEELSNDSDVQLEIVSESETPIIEIASQPSLDIEPALEELGEFVSDFESLQDEKIISSVHTTGSVGNAVTGATGAVDRLTQEIMDSLEENSTMVVWLFDQSASLTRQREEIEGRLDRIYRELDLLRDAGAEQFKSDDEKPLLTHVYAFGQSVGPVLKKPTDDVSRIKEAMKSIQRDTSGIENVFSAVMRCARDFADFRKVNRATGKRKRNVKIVILSDEAGDDGDLADQAIKVCEKLTIPVYVIGVPAPFGRAETRVKWVDPDPQYDQRPQVARVSQGPESLMPERLSLNFIGSDFQDLEMIDSGFGPFQLTRMCYQTGGIYFAVHPNRRRGRVSFRETAVYSSDLRYFFEPDAMRKYQPDYVTMNEYRRRANGNQARLSLLNAAAVPTTEQIAIPQFRFPKFTEAAFVRDIGRAQRSSAILQPRLDRLYRILTDGERDREKEASPRWRAGFDLAMGRVTAARLRSKSYNELLALSKTKLNFKDPKNNTWVLRPSNDLTTTGSQNEKLAGKAEMYLNRVVAEHPGTPWALLA
ncbi:MAG: vWA domain-containing protein, partial [Planctomycetota bacterium]